MKYSSTINRTLVIIATLAVLAGSASVIRAYTPPTSTPPSGGVPAPVNVGTVGQIKLGGFGANWLTASNGAWIVGSAAPDAASLIVMGNTTRINDGIGNNLFISDGTGAGQAGKVLTLQGDGTAKWDIVSGGTTPPPVTPVTLGDLIGEAAQYKFDVGYTPSIFQECGNGVYQEWPDQNGNDRFCRYIYGGVSPLKEAYIEVFNKSLCTLSRSYTDNGGNETNGDVTRVHGCQVVKYSGTDTWQLHGWYGWYSQNGQNGELKTQTCEMTCFD